MIENCRQIPNQVLSKAGVALLLAHLRRLSGGILSLLIVAACADYGQVKNEALTDDATGQQYSLAQWKQTSRSTEVLIMLTFSGGGTRAAALSYGVMQELRDTNIVIDGKTVRLLDQVSHISSVSGGSFTSAYYGLHGDGLFDTFESQFLRVDVDKHLEWMLLNPELWFSKTGRTDAAIKYYQNQIFHGATFKDMMKPGRPLILINASDLSHGIRFSFIQDYFDLLCSDLASFPVARAVAASSSVPVLFEPVVLENYSDCYSDDMPGVKRLREYSENLDSETDSRLASQLMSYSNKDKRKYIHLVDGGITDNLGLRAISDIIEISGGADAYMHHTKNLPPHRLVIIEVNAATDSHKSMDLSAKQPRVDEVMGAVSYLQLERYDWETIKIIEDNLDKWAQQLSSEQRTVSPYYVKVRLSHAAKKDWKYVKDLPIEINEIPTNEDLPVAINDIPTSFTLSDKQVDLVIESGRRLLRENPVFQQLLSDIGQP